MAKKSKRRKPAPTVPEPAPVPTHHPEKLGISILNWFKRTRNQAGLLFLFAFVLYGNTLGHDFTVDDAIVITDNSLVKKGFAGIGDIFTHDTFYGFFEDESKANLVAGGRYRPLTLAMFAVEQQISSGPFISHLFNVIWYGALLVLLLRFVTDLCRNRQLAWWVAPIIVGLFAAHSVHTEAVANIKGRDEIVALFFSVAAAWLTWRSAKNANWLGAVAGAGCMALACLAKETSFTFLAVIPAAVLLFPPDEQGKGKNPNRLIWSNLKYCIPVLGAALLYLAIRSAVLPEGNGQPILELMNNPFVEWKNGIWAEVPTAERVATGFYTLLLYLKRCFTGTGLVHDYYPTAIPLQSWSDIGPWIGLVVHGALGIFALLKWKNHRLLAYGIIIYLATISIASNIPFSVGTLMSERFLFFPTLGWVLAVGYGLSRLGEKIGGKAAIVGLSVVAIFSILTIARNPDWKDNYTLFTTDVLKQPNSAKLRNAAGGARVDKYQSYPEAGKPGVKYLLAEAITDLDEAIRIHPTYRNAYLIRGNAKLLSKDFDAAIADYEEALRLSPSYQPAQDNLFVALIGAGRTAGEERGDIQGAFEYLRKAEKMRPMDYEMLRLLGVASGVSGQNEQAVGYFERAAAVKPKDADAIWNYGTALYNAGRPEEAQVQFSKAKAIRPSIATERGL